MSASKQKKIRQEQANDVLVKEKLEKKNKELKQEKKTRALYITVFVLFILLGLFLLFTKSGIREKKAVSCDINGEKFSVAELNYFYQNAVSEITSSDYASYYGLDTSTSYDSQEIGSFAQYLLGVDTETMTTWDDYFRLTAEDNLKSTYAVYQKAIAEGKDYTEEVASLEEETDETVAYYANQYGYTSSQYIKLLYGNTMTLDLFHELLKMSNVASLYTEEYEASLTYSDSDLEAGYQASKSDYDVADYEYIAFYGTPDTEYDESGNAIEATEEETALALEQAKNNADEAFATVKKSKNLEDVAESYEDADYSNVEDGTYYSSDLLDWVFDETRQSGDLELIESDTTYYIVLFHSCERNDYNTVNVRHILISVDSSELDSSSETYDEELQALNDAAKAQAEAVLEEFADGTEDDFAQLASTYSADTGSSSNGGLYEDVYKGEMVEEFEDWCFDESRQIGDTGIVETSYGYHVMYFSGFGDVYWKIQVKDQLLTDDMNNWIDDIIASYTLTEQSGIKYVGAN